MKLLKAGEKLKYLEKDYTILNVVIGTDNHVFYQIDYKNDGDVWNIYAGILDGEKVTPLFGIWCE